MTTIPTAYGNLSVPDWDSDLIVRMLRTNGEWAFAEQLLLAPLIRPQDRVWDVGAFLGTYGIGLAQLAPHPPARLLAVEPGDNLFPHLLANLQKNAPCPFDIARCAVGEKTGRLRIKGRSQDDNAGALAFEPDAQGDGTIPCKSLPDLRAEHGGYDVLKLDVEGMENDVLRGDIAFIKKHQPVIWAECNETTSSIALLEALVWLGYEPLYVGFPYSRYGNFHHATEKPFPMAYEAALLAAPKDRMAAFTGKVAGEDIIIQPVRTSYDLRRAMWSTPRWSLDEWEQLSKPQLVALLGHQLRNEDLLHFLNNTA